MPDTIEVWPHVLSPDVQCILGPIPERDGWLEHDPIVYPTVADSSNLKNSDGHDGHFKPHAGKEFGAGVIKRQDTYKNGTGGRTGRAFDVISGTWSDNCTGWYSHSFCLLQADSSLSTTGEVISHDTTVNIENCQIVLGRGHIPPVSAASHTFTKSDTYFKLFLAWGQTSDICIVGEYGQPIRVDVTADAWATTRTGVSIIDGTSNLNKYLETHNHAIPISINANYQYNYVDIEIADGHHARVTLYNPVNYDSYKGKWQASLIPPAPPLPTVGKIRLLVANSYSTFEYYPMRYQTLNSKRQIDNSKVTTHPNIANAVVATDGRNIANPNQKVVPVVSTDGSTVAINLATTMPDAGDSLGAADPPELVDATLIIPAVWTFDIDGSIDTRAPFYGKVIHLDMWQEFNDITRMVTRGCSLILDNADGSLNGFWGNRAIDIVTSTGNGYQTAFTGITGADKDGVVHYKVDTVKRVALKCQDFSRKMMAPIGQEITLDGMCVYNAVRLLGELNGIHPKYMTSFPNYVPPGCTLDAPYGPAGSDCPYPILAKGSGLNARYNYKEDSHGWDIFQQIVQDTGLPIESGKSLPFYGGFQIDGQMIFAAFDPITVPPVAFYSSQDTSGLAQLEDISVSYSTEGMRTQVSFTGINPWTYRAEYMNFDPSVDVKRAIGYPERWIERNPRYSGEYLVGILNTAGAMSSLPTISPRFSVPYLNNVNAGNRVELYDELLGNTLDGYIIFQNVSIGMSDRVGFKGQMQADASIIMRWIGNAPHS